MLRIDVPITKIDVARRLVHAVAACDRPDRAGEICDYASTKPLYEKWSEAIATSSGGRSLGNLRALHGKVAAGKVAALAFNDEARQIEIVAKVVDDAEWAKVEEGVYTGFSQGGSYAKRWTDASGATRYTADPNEISLVDLPCLAAARFEMVKADGAHEWRRFKSQPVADHQVDHPSHYGGADNPYEVIKVIRAWGLGFSLGNAVKYLARAGKKDPAKHVEDLKKARWYLDEEIAQLEAANHDA